MIYSLSLPFLLATGAASLPRAAADVQPSALATTRVMSVEFSWNVSSSLAYAVGRPTAAITQIVGIPLIAEESPAGLSFTTMGLAWTTVPVSGNMLRQAATRTVPTVIWTFPNGIMLNASQSLVFWCFGGANLTTTAVMQVGFTVDE